MRHPYTEALLRSIPSTDMASHTRLHPIPGRPPDLLNPPQGCAFAARCRYAQPECVDIKPALLEGSGEHWYACHFPVGTAEGRAALERNEAAGVTAAGLPLDEAAEEFV
jgi:peptide/nickel transport system ATP-binding protein